MTCERYKRFFFKTRSNEINCWTV